MSVTVNGTEVERLIVEDASSIAGSCVDRRVARIVIQEAGIPGPGGGGGGADLTEIEFVPPLSYDAEAQRVRIDPPPQIGQVMRWDGTAWVPFSLPERRVERREITEAEANAGEISLSFPVTNPGSIVFEIGGNGAPQFVNEDFFLEGQTIRWSGGPLEGLLESGDKLLIVYE